MTDQEIIGQILQGDKNRYKLLVERYQPIVFRTCIGFLHNKEDADDLTQDIFIQTYQKLPSYKGDCGKEREDPHGDFGIFEIIGREFG